MHSALIGQRVHTLSGSCARSRGSCATLGHHLASAPAWPTADLLVVGRHSARAKVLCSASKVNFYDILGVPETATERDIKSAYRKKALKLHPDVNKAPDAQQRFMEAKMAFETLGDAKQRAEYDRKLRMGFGSDWGSSSGFGSYGSYSGSKRRSSEPEDNYSFADLMRDLDKELNSWMKSKGSSQPKSLIEELSMLGEATTKRVKRSLQELVDFLEDTIGVKEDGPAGKKASSSSSSSSSSTQAGSQASSGSTGQRPSKARSPVDEFDELWSKYVDPIGKNSSGAASSSSGSSGSSSKRYSSTSSSTGSSTRAAPAQSSDDDIDAMLAELKKKVKKN